VTEYQVVRETGSKAHTVTATDEIDKVHETDEMEADDSGKVYQVNKTAKLQQDEQERAHQVNEKAQMSDKAESYSVFLSCVANKMPIVRTNPLLKDPKEHAKHV